jgi:glycerol transport system substrate-binding protein
MRHLDRTRFWMMTSAVALTAAAAAVTSPVRADEAAAKKWVDSGEFQPSTLSKDDQLKELNWFVKAAAPFKGM